MPVLIDEVTAAVEAERPPAEEQNQPPAPAPSPQMQLDLQRRYLRKLEQRKARLKAD